MNILTNKPQIFFKKLLAFVLHPACVWFVANASLPAAVCGIQRIASSSLFPALYFPLLCHWRSLTRFIHEEARRHTSLYISFCVKGSELFFRLPANLHTTDTEQHCEYIFASCIHSHYKSSRTFIYSSRLCLSHSCYRCHLILNSRNVFLLIPDGH